MEQERYRGEARILQRFLAVLRPVVERELEDDSLLRHAIRRALSSGQLADLRRARQHFNHLPRPMKQRLSTGIVIAALGTAPGRSGQEIRPS